MVAREIKKWHSLGLAMVLPLVFASCLHYPRFSFGELPTGHACVAVFPLLDLSKGGVGDEHLGEYLTLALRNSGFKATLGPRDVGYLFESAGMEMPNSVDQIMASRIGKQLEADSVLYGQVSRYFLGEETETNDNPDILLGIDLYLADLNSDSIAWVFSTRFYTRRKDYLSDLAKLSSDVSRTLLSSGSALRMVGKDDCWDKPRISLNLAGGGFSAKGHRPKGAEKAAQVVEKPLEKKAPPERTVTLTGKAAEHYRTLKANKPIVLRSLFVDRSDRFVERQAAALVPVATAMGAFPAKTKFEIQGHVDATRKRDNDFWLSAKQVGVVVERLQKLNPGLKEKVKIAAKGGGTPIMPNVNRISRRQNRRIEVRLLP